MSSKGRIVLYCIVYTYFLTATFTKGDYDFNFTTFGWFLYLSLLFYGYYFFVKSVRD